MSLLWRDRLRIALTPTAVALVRSVAGYRGRAKQKALLSCAPTAGERPWEAALGILKDALPQEAWRHSVATVVLSNHFVRYLLLPWSTDLASPAEQAAYARHNFRDVYGDGAADWEVRWNDEPPGALRVASAVDSPLLAGLRAAMPASVRLASVQPYLAAAFNHWRSQLKHPTGWFCLAEPGRLCVSRFGPEGWLGLQSERITDGWARALPEALDRERLRQGEGDPSCPIYIHGVASADLREPALRSARILELRPAAGIDADAGAAFSLALCG